MIFTLKVAHYFAANMLCGQSLGTKFAAFCKRQFMPKRPSSKKAKSIHVSKYTGNKITPFVEVPSIDHAPREANKPGKEDEARLPASELFSLFTADIIRQDVLFTR